MDLFIDALNPLNKKIHETLQSRILRQRAAIASMKKQRAEQRAEEIRQQGVVILVLISLYIFIPLKYLTFTNI